MFMLSPLNGVLVLTVVFLLLLMLMTRFIPYQPPVSPFFLYFSMVKRFDLLVLFFAPIAQVPTHKAVLPYDF